MPCAANFSLNTQPWLEASMHSSYANSGPSFTLPTSSSVAPSSLAISPSSPTPWLRLLRVVDSRLSPPSLLATSPFWPAWSILPRMASMSIVDLYLRHLQVPNLSPLQIAVCGAKIITPPGHQFQCTFSCNPFGAKDQAGPCPPPPLP